jgi:uncharacterized protein (TIGR03067 family)
MFARILTVAVVLFLPTLLRADDAPKGDKDLDGVWELQSEFADGKEVQCAPDRIKSLATFQGKSEVVRIIVKGTGTIVVLAGPFDEGYFGLKIDATKKPKIIDVTAEEGRAKGETRLGIYEVKGDVLRICQAPSGEDRPTEFSSKEGTGWTLKTFKRAKK